MLVLARRVQVGIEQAELVFRWSSGASEATVTLKAAVTVSSPFLGDRHRCLQSVEDVVLEDHVAVAGGALAPLNDGP